jgi:alkylation response protein AidB-like acyl-CoA dehydrogenase
VSAGTYASAESLEHFLGDPREPGSVVSFTRALEQDEREEFPEEAFAALGRWGFQHHYIPAELGGRLRSLEELLALARVLSRRDLTLAIGHGKTYLGLVPVWGMGSAEQQRRVAALAATNAPISLGLTERAHGSDLLATEVRAEAFPGGYLLSGEKWLINNATRSRAMVVLARTDERPGPRSLSLVLVEKERAAPASLRHLPKVRTHGIRGADISGLAFQGTELPADVLVGGPGTGLETVLRVIQLTRLMCAGFSLGAGDTALRCTLDFARERKLYGSTALAIPHVRRVLVDAFADLLLADAAALTGARLAHVAPEQLSVGAAVVKYFVPTTLEGMIRDLSVVLGARYYLRDEHWGGIFQKLSRDAPVVSLFDGSTAVNLQALGMQLRHLAEGAAEAAPDEAREEALFRLGTSLPPLRHGGLALSASGRDLVVRSLRGSVTRLQALEDVGSGTRAALVRQASHLLEEVGALRGALAALEDREGLGVGRSPGLFHLARRYCAIHAAAASLGLWLHNREALEEDFRRGDWLVPCLDRVAPGVAEPSAQQLEATLRRLETLSQQGRLFSAVPFRLAGADQRARP